MATFTKRFWDWYHRHYLLNLSVATGLFLLQAFHLYWLTTDVVLARLLGHSVFLLPDALWPVYVLVDYTEIPALLATSVVYLDAIRRRSTAQAWLALAAVNIQWVHLFWITDEVVFQALTGGPLVGLPPAVAWLAIVIDYLELPVMVDTVRKLASAIRDARAGAQVALWKRHWQDEGDAAFAYRVLAAHEPDPSRAAVYAQLAAVEDQHVARWAQILSGAGVAVGPHRPSLRIRTLALLGRVGGWKLLMTILLAEEGREMRGYLDAAGAYTDPGAVRTATVLARESAVHAEQLGALLGTPGEPWHRGPAADALAAGTHAFSVGLLASFGLIMGVIGAGVPQPLVGAAALAGLAASALAMGGSTFLSAKGGRDAYAYEMAVEQEELRLMPDLEEAELALLYRTRGLAPEAAQQAAREVMRDPDRALAEKGQLELGVARGSTSPLRDGWRGTLATAGGAAVPVLPVLLLRDALWATVLTSAFGAFIVGGARSAFTGRSASRSGLEMLAIGLGVGLVGYLVGMLIARAI